MAAGARRAQQHGERPQQGDRRQRADHAGHPRRAGAAVGGGVGLRLQTDRGADRPQDLAPLPAQAVRERLGQQDPDSGREPHARHERDQRALPRSWCQSSGEQRPDPPQHDDHHERHRHREDEHDVLGPVVDVDVGEGPNVPRPQHGDERRDDEPADLERDEHEPQRRPLAHRQRTTDDEEQGGSEDVAGDRDVEDAEDGAADMGRRRRQRGQHHRHQAPHRGEEHEPWQPRGHDVPPCGNALDVAAGHRHAPILPRSPPRSPRQARLRSGP